MERARPVLVAIVGGSGSGKTWLAGRLAATLGASTLRISQDDFYRDLGHLPLARRARVNFDHPRTIDWPELERALHDLAAGRPTSLPVYDFATHTRRPERRTVQPCRVVLVEGLWLLRRRKLRSAFAITLYLDCPARLRRDRRLARDTALRGRTRTSVMKQFREQVAPMHRRWVEPQRRHATQELRSPIPSRRVKALAADILQRLRGHVASGTLVGPPER
jgi:uridine kinase